MSEASKPVAKNRTARGQWKPGVSGNDAVKWKPGISGNPSGRPKSALISQALRARLAEIDPNDPEGRTLAEKLAETLTDLAIGGDVVALKEIADRCEGRSQQNIQVAATALSMTPEKANALILRLFQIQAEQQGLRLVDGEGEAVDPSRLLPAAELDKAS